MWVEPIRMFSAGMRLTLARHAIAQHRGEAEQVERHDGDRDVALAEDDRPGRQLAPFLLGRVGRPHPARDRQERIRRDHPHRGPDLDLGVSRGPPARHRDA